jgi:hypothetical protein
MAVLTVLTLSLLIGTAWAQSDSTNVRVQSFKSFVCALFNHICSPDIEAKRTAVERYFVEVTDLGMTEVVTELFAPDAKQHFVPCLDLQGWEQIMQYVGLTALLFTEGGFQTIVNDIVVEGDTAYSFQTHIATPITMEEREARCAALFPPGECPIPPVVPLRLGGAPLPSAGDPPITVQWDAMARFTFNDDNLITEEWIVRDELSMALNARQICAPGETPCLCGATCADF